MSNSDLSNYHTRKRELENIITSIKARDSLYLRIARERDATGFNNRRKDHFINTEIKPRVEKRRKAGEYLSYLLERNKNLISMYGTLGAQYDLDKENTEKYIEKLDYEERTDKEKKSFLEREHQILKYKTNISDETIHLLYIMLVVQIILCLVVLLNYFKIMDRIIVSFLIIIIIIFFILYVIKIVLIDRANLNTYFYKKIDFNKPKEDEIFKKDPTGESDEIMAYKVIEQEDKCNQGLKSYDQGAIFEGDNDELLQEVKDNVGSQISSNQRCLISGN